MSFLESINAQVAQNAVEAEHQGVINQLKKKYGSLDFSKTIGKTIERVDVKHDGVILIFTDGTYVRGQHDRGYEEVEQFYSWDLELDEVAEQGLMSVDDKINYDAAKEYFGARSKDCEGEQLLHRVISHFGRDKLRELLA